MMFWGRAGGRTFYINPRRGLGYRSQKRLSVSGVPFPFPGTEQEARELGVAVGHSCECPTTQPFNMHPSPHPRCAAHQMLLDKRVVYGLVYFRHLADRLLLEEFNAIERGRQAL